MHDAKQSAPSANSIPSAPQWDSPQILNLIRAALEEDVGYGDLTAEFLVSASTAAHARLMAKQALVLAGMPLFERVFAALSSDVRVEPHFVDGQAVPEGTLVARIAGPARPILSAERTALNFLAHLSGVATLTRKFTEAIAGTRAAIRDTRKTTPLLRTLEKYAVRCGGGENHRFGLYDAILIKENHIALAGGVAEAVRRARAVRRNVPAEMTAYESFQSPRPTDPAGIQVEVRSEDDLRKALSAGAEAVLLDNTAPAEAARLIAVARTVNPRCVIEVSGGVNLSSVRAFAEAGADYISIGALTHSAPAADLSLLVDSAAVE